MKSKKSSKNLKISEIFRFSRFFRFSKLRFSKFFFYPKTHFFYLVPDFFYLLRHFLYPTDTVGIIKTEKYCLHPPEKIQTRDPIHLQAPKYSSKINRTLPGATLTFWIFFATTRWSAGAGEFFLIPQNAFLIPQNRFLIPPNTFLVPHRQRRHHKNIEILF